MDNLLLKVEKIVVKGEIARYEQFLLSPKCFQKSSDAGFPHVYNKFTADDFENV